MIRRGITQVELIVYTAAVVVLGLAVFPAFLSLNNVTDSAVNDPGNEFELRQLTAAVAERIRAALPCDTTAGCTGTHNTAVVTADSDRIVFYTTTGGATREIRTTSGTGVTMTEGGTTTTLIPGATISFKYCTSATGTYNMSGDPYQTSWWGTSVTGASLKNIAAVWVSATRTVDGRTYTQSATVRMRNSPVKTNSIDY